MIDLAHCKCKQNIPPLWGEGGKKWNLKIGKLILMEKVHTIS